MKLYLNWKANLIIELSTLEFFMFCVHWIQIGIFMCKKMCYDEFMWTM